MKEMIKTLVEMACDCFYAGEDYAVIRTLLQAAKKLHVLDGGNFNNWIGTTDDREIWNEFPYESIALF